MSDFEALRDAVVGAAGNYAVIYTAVNPATVGEWVTPFPRGYAVGRGVDLSGTFDGFEPVASNSIEIIIDDLDNIEFVNWT